MHMPDKKQEKQENKKVEWVRIPLKKEFMSFEGKPLLVANDDNIPEQDRGKVYTFARFLLGASDTADANLLIQMNWYFERIYEACTAVEYRGDDSINAIWIPKALAYELAASFRRNAMISAYMLTQFINYINKEAETKELEKDLDFEEVFEEVIE